MIIWFELRILFFKNFERMKNLNIRNILLVGGIPTVYALALRGVFGIGEWSDLFTVMSVSFLFLLPFIVGALTIYFSKTENIRNIAYRILMPWIPIMAFFVITLLFAIEGWACWIMVMPLFLIAASIGGLIGAYLKLRKQNKLYISFLVLIPFFSSPIEHAIGSIPATFRAYTCIDIQAPAEKIWKNVTRVHDITEEDDKGYLSRLLGFPRPVKAVLNYEGVGAYREASFTGGLVFHETVTEYEHLKKMVFSIKANTYEIPSTTLDEHVLIGGKYFDVLNGTYELEHLNDSTHRLHLYSHFVMNTSFNFYAGWWGEWIMKDIQNNILQIEKMRAENE